MKNLMIAVSLGIVCISVVSLIFVAKITEIGGAQYDWEYFFPVMMLIYGLWRLLVYARKSQ
jgi:hypothetical protein